MTALGDEATTDYWTARRRAADGATPTLSGPDYTGWRRAWDVTRKRRLGIAGWNTPPAAPLAGPRLSAARR